MNACAVVTRSQLAHARVLAESLRAHHPDARVDVLVADDRAGRAGSGEPFEIVKLEELGLDARRLHLAAFLLPVGVFTRALMPWLVRAVLERGAESVLCLAPESWILGPLHDLDARARCGRTLVLPRPDVHRAPPTIEPGDPPLVDGACDPGFLWASQASRPFIDWWANELLARPMPAPDARFIDLALARAETELVRDVTVGLAWWSGRPDVAFEGASVTVDGKPLRLARFPAPERREPATVASLRARYGETLRARGLAVAADEPYGWGSLPDGTPVDTRMRRLYRRAVADDGSVEGLPDPFDPGDPDAFVSWLASSPDGRGVSRYLLKAHEEEMTIRARFPHVPGDDTEEYLSWAREQGHGCGIPRRLVGLSSADGAAVRQAAGALDRGGLNVVGPFRRAHGLAEAARQLVAALRQAGVPLATALSTPGHDPGPVSYADDGPSALRFDTNLLCVNVNEIVAFTKAFPASLLDDRYTIGFWWWEVSRLDDDLADAFDCVDEVWAGSDYVRDVLARYTRKPVISMPFAALFPVAEAPGRAELGLPEGFMFLFMFDFYSRLERKNPTGIVEAFRKAFAPAEGPVLVIKSLHGEESLDDFERLRLAVGNRPDIRLLDGFVSARFRTQLMASCDCYVSLHRSEGLGLTIAEAMANHKPVITTAYSGNMSFTTHENAFLVPYSMTTVPDTCPLYPHGAVWADPDVEAAAGLMRLVYEDADRRRRVAERGAREVRERLDPRHAAQAMAARLAEIWAA